MSVTQEDKRRRRQYILARLDGQNAALTRKYAEAAACYRKAATFAALPFQERDSLRLAAEYDQAAARHQPAT